MAKLKEYLQVGQIRKGHGLDGLIKMTLKADFTHVIDKTDHFYRRKWSETSTFH